MAESENDTLTEREDVSVTLPDIRALVAERQRFDDWLTALESKRAETPVRVFERVHADYVARRDAVIEGLHAHIGSLESLERDLDGRLQLLESQLAEREDARAEGMLRTAVGEFDSDRWEVTRQEVEAAIAQYGADREALMAETDDVRSLLASARHRPAAEPEPEPEPLVVASEPDVHEEFVSTSVAEAIAHADPAAVEHTVNLDADGEPTLANDETAPHTQDDDLLTTDPYLRAVRQQAEGAREIESGFSVSEQTFEPVAHATPDAVSHEVPHFAAHDVEGSSQAAAAERAAEARVESERAAYEQSAYGQAASESRASQPSAESEREREDNAAIDALGFESLSNKSEVLEDIDVFGESVAPRNTSDSFPSRSAVDPFAPGAQSSTPSTPFPGNSTPSPSAPNANVFDEFAFLRSVTESGSAMPNPNPPRAGSTTDQAKTLRCTECGTMNFPTEWYCERCGGELATF